MTNESPVSVAMATYNGARFLREQLSAAAPDMRHITEKKSEG